MPLPPGELVVDALRRDTTDGIDKGASSSGTFSEENARATARERALVALRAVDDAARNAALAVGVYAKLRKDSMQSKTVAGDDEKDPTLTKTVRSTARTIGALGGALCELQPAPSAGACSEAKAPGTSTLPRPIASSAPHLDRSFASSQAMVDLAPPPSQPSGRPYPSRLPTYLPPPPMAAPCAPRVRSAPFELPARLPRSAPAQTELFSMPRPFKVEPPAPASAPAATGLVALAAASPPPRQLPTSTFQLLQPQIPHH